MSNTNGNKTLRSTPVPEQYIVHIDGHRIGNVHQITHGKDAGRWVTSDAQGRRTNADASYDTAQEAADAMTEAPQRGVRDFTNGHEALPGEEAQSCRKCGKPASVKFIEASHGDGYFRAVHLQVDYGRGQFVTEEACYWRRDA